MRKLIEAEPHLEPGRKAGTLGRRRQAALRARRALIVGAVFLALMAGGAPAADAAASSEDTLVQTNRFCWWSSC